MGVFIGLQEYRFLICVVIIFLQLVSFFFFFTINVLVLQRWPNEEIPNFQSNITSAYETMTELSFRVLSAMALGLQLVRKTCWHNKRLPWPKIAKWRFYILRRGQLRVVRRIWIYHRYLRLISFELIINTRFSRYWRSARARTSTILAGKRLTIRPHHRETNVKCHTF